MFIIWHTLLIVGFLAVAFFLGYLTGKQRKDLTDY